MIGLPRHLRRVTALMAFVVLPAAGRAQTGAGDAIPPGWWTAPTPADREVVMQRILATGRSFDALYRALGKGRAYRTDVPTGRIVRSRTNADGTEHPYYFLVPADYDPGRRYPVRVYLHGGVARVSPGRDGEWWRRPDPLARDDEIAVFPAGWGQSLWWQWRQVENLAGILSELKREYNIDENRVYLFGVSDGASGAYFHAFKAPAIWAGFVALIGHPAVLSNPRLRSGGEMFVRNLRNRPVFMANAEDDRLYPVRSIRPFLDLFDAVGVDVTFRGKPGDHSVSWWPEEADSIEAFVRRHPRDPLSDRVDWQTERTDRGNRLHWLVIRELGDVPGDRGRLEPLPEDLFPHFGPSGRARAERAGNTISVTTTGVRRLAILLSPETYDFRRPVRVEVNGDLAFDERVEPSAHTLLRWAARDEDRTERYAVEIEVTVAAGRGGTARVVP